MKFNKKSALIFPTGLNLLEKKTQKLIQGIFRISDLIKFFLEIFLPFFWFLFELKDFRSSKNQKDITQEHTKQFKEDLNAEKGIKKGRRVIKSDKITLVPNTKKIEENKRAQSYFLKGSSR